MIAAGEAFTKNENSRSNRELLQTREDLAEYEDLRERILRRDGYRSKTLIAPK